MNDVLKFIKRERLYMFLFAFVIIVHLMFSLANQIYADRGIDRAFGQEAPEDRGALSAGIEELVKSNPIISLLSFLFFIGFVFFIIAGIAIDLVYLYLKRSNTSPIIKKQIAEAGKWDFWDICKVIIIFIFARCVVLIAYIFLFSGLSYLQERSSLSLMLSTTLIDIIAIAAVFYYVLRERHQTLGPLGLSLKHFFVNIRYGVFAYIGLIPILSGVMFLTISVFKIFGIPVKPQDVLVILINEKHIPTLIYMCFFTGIFGPVMEEIFFRGFTYTALKKNLGIFGAIAASSLFFAYVHANLASFFPIFCLGLVLAYLFERTGSLVPSITVHIIHNSASLVFLLLIKIIAG